MYDMWEFSLAITILGGGREEEEEKKRQGKEEKGGEQKHSEVWFSFPLQAIKQHSDKAWCSLINIV